MTLAVADVPEWTARDAAPFVRVPAPEDDKYAHGVLGVVTGSDKYPGAAVLGVDAAFATGVGMVRYLGPDSVASLVLARRPETVVVEGRVQAWLIGSGLRWTMPGKQPPAITEALESGLAVVVDAGALPLVAEVTGPRVITPHRDELGLFARVRREDVDADPLGLASKVADEKNTVVVLKGHTTLIVGPELGQDRFVRKVTAPTTWLATAGTGDVLAGIMGALAATHAELLAERPDSLAELAATACLLHGRAAEKAGNGGPFGASDISAHLAEAIAGLV